LIAPFAKKNVSLKLHDHEDPSTGEAAAAATCGSRSAWIAGAAGLGTRALRLHRKFPIALEVRRQRRERIGWRTLRNKTHKKTLTAPFEGASPQTLTPGNVFSFFNFFV